jgi:hypothetical protein
MSEPERYVHGAFAVFSPYPKEQTSYPHGRMIPFRFNPEALSRSLQIEQAQQNQGTEGAQPRRGGSNTEQSTDASDGPLKQTFSVMIRFDLRDRLAANPVQATDEGMRLGVLPEIAALEELMYPAERPAADDRRQAVAQRPPRPVVLLVWGIHRVFPVRVVSMTINEVLHNADLAPVRAEIEVGLEVARDESTGHQATVDALGYMNSQRKEHASRFYATVSSQGTSVTSLGEIADTKLRGPL